MEFLRMLLELESKGIRVWLSEDGQRELGKMMDEVAEKIQEAV